MGDSGLMDRHQVGRLGAQGGNFCDSAQSGWGSSAAGTGRQRENDVLHEEYVEYERWPAMEREPNANEEVFPGNWFRTMSEILR